MFSKVATVCIVLQIAALTSGNSTSVKDKSYRIDRRNRYPQQLIDDLVQKEKLIKIEHALGRRGDLTLNSDCEARVLYNPIYEIMDENDNVRYVVQTSDNAKKPFRQILRIEECVNPGKITQNTVNFNLESSALKYYDFYCVQTFINYSFLVLSLDGQRLETVKAKGGIPVCCKCIVKEKNDY